MRMRRFSRIVIALLLLAAWQNTRLSAATDEEAQVKATLDHFFASADGHDWKSVGALLTDDFEMFTDGPTVMNKTDYLKLMAQDNLRVTQMRLRDLSIHVSPQGQMSWCRYRGIFHMYEGSQSSLVETAETVVLRHESDGWKLVQAQASMKQRPWRRGPHADTLLFSPSENEAKGN